MTFTRIAPGVADVGADSSDFNIVDRSFWRLKNASLSYTLPARLMRNIAQVGGVHTFIDTEDVVWASKELVAVCVKDAGKRTVRLPAKADVRDLYSGEIVGQDVEAFTVDFKDRATRVFVTE